MHQEGSVSLLFFLSEGNNRRKSEKGKEEKRKKERVKKEEGEERQVESKRSSYKNNPLAYNTKRG